MMASIVEREGNRQFVDTRGLGRPDKFSGKDEEWVHWKLRLESWLQSQHVRAPAILCWAEGEIEAISRERVQEANAQAELAGSVALDGQLYALLVSLMPSPSVGFDIVRNTPKLEETLPTL